MANPIIESVTVVYANGLNYKLPGEAAEIYVNAIDADALQITVNVTVTDAAGNISQEAALVVQNDPLTYAATSEQEGVQVVADPTTPNRFFVT